MIRRTINGRVLLLAALVLNASLYHAVAANTWPTYRGDNRRSGHSKQALDVRHLGLRWVWHSSHPPRPAWAGPAKRDAYRNLRGLPSMRDYDVVFHTVGTGGLVFFGSSVDDSVHCLDASTGKEQWLFTADAPVRIAPSVFEDRVYFGSDDGYTYCVDANRGTLIWKFRPVDDDQRVLNNGRLISRWPCRTGVLIADNTAYFANSLLPWKESYLCAVDAQTGAMRGKNHFIKKLKDMTLEGPIAASPNMLIVPQGRVAPRLFNLSDGASLGNLKGGGGSFVVLTPGDNILHGPASDTRGGAITNTSAKTRAPIATYKNGNAIVVAGQMSYMLTDDSLIASDFVKRKHHWTVACEYPYCLILVGDQLLVGGEDEVAAFDTKSGQKTWTHAVDGKAYGISVVDGHILISTDTGAIYAFDTDGEVKPSSEEPVATSNDAVDSAAKAELQAIEPDKDERLVGRWVFQSPYVGRRHVQDLTGKNNVSLSGSTRVERAGRYEAIHLDGRTTSVLINPNCNNAAGMPKKQLTAAAWVRVDQPMRWGGIVGAVLDNGSHERGWLLGFEGSKFSFAVCGKKGSGGLTYLTATSNFDTKRWYHVVGTYDGAAMKIYVDGALAATSADQKGDISYPDKTFYEIGAYHDSNEYYRSKGMLHEVRVYDHALSTSEIKAQFERKAGSFGDGAKRTDTTTLATGPWVDFERRGSAVIRWYTESPSPTLLEYWHRDKASRVEEPELKTKHAVNLDQLKHNRVYEYRIGQHVEGKEQRTEVYQFDTFFNYKAGEASPKKSPYPETSTIDYATVAQHVLKQSTMDRGICVDIGCGNGRLAYELACRSRLRIIGFDTDKEKVAAARKFLHDSGLYGERISIHHVQRLDSVSMPSLSANLVVSSRLLQGEPQLNIGSEVERVLQPRGVAILGRPASEVDRQFESTLRKWFAPTKLGLKIATSDKGLWARLGRGKLTGTGEWSHLYGSPDNSAYGGESLAGVTRSDELRIQWIGRPGPRYQSDRANRKPSPLSTGGRLFLQGWRRIIAVDAYNGTPLWSLEIPHFERFNVPRDCGNWCSDEDHVYAAVRDQCWKIDARNGSVVKLLGVVAAEKSERAFDWGYVASEGDNLVGTAVRHGTSWTNIWGGSGEGWYDAKSGPVTAQICSDNLFSLNKVSGKTNWEYSSGIILNSTVTIGAGRIYFVESRNKAVQTAEQRRVGAVDLWKDQYLVALDTGTGNKVWERPIDTADGTVAFYLAFSNGKLVINSAGDGKYHVYAFDSTKGEPLWDQSVAWQRSHHGGHMSRPAIVEGTLYIRPYAMDLYTGKILPTRMPGGGCGTYACTSNALLFRASTITMWDREAGRSSTWNRLRPDCWLSTIPAGGMLLAPEGGGGCSCGKWMETSIGFIPNHK